jgi:hypothetical protein
MRTASKTDDRKRLGQYFTGERLSSLLAHLSLADVAGSVIDPMAGSGDMLVAAHSAGAADAVFGAVEIDPEAGQLCADRLAALSNTDAHVCIGDAFSHETWGQMADRAWDLVITNPPYVRYQRSAAVSNGRVLLPDARRVRRGLIDFLERCQLLRPVERQVMHTLANGYSGLADMAVPSWLLCAALVAVGGRLAIVAPDTWLSRDYAQPVLYLLRRFFELEIIVEDGEAVWFEDALVRTNLVVARRVEDRGSALDLDARSYVRVRLDKTTIDETSIVGALLPNSHNSDREFAEIVRGLTPAQVSRQFGGCSITWVTDEDVRGLLAGATDSKWLRAVEPGSGELLSGHTPTASSFYLPPKVIAAAGRSEVEWQSLAGYGWSVGQGLRTGANRFFYGELVRDDKSSVLLGVDPAITPEPLEVPPSLLHPAIRKQNDLDGGFIASAATPGRVLALQDYALSEDNDETATLLGSSPYEEIPEPLASHVRRASLTDVSRSGRPKLIPTLSAVATNVRAAQVDRPNLPPRFWYQLPAFAPRHVPALLMPRVNHGHPRGLANPDGLLVDANFSTLWPQSAAALPAWAVLSLLNSTWVSVVLENAATILGGGALKVEATHLRRLPLPSLESEHVAKLTELGSKLADAPADRYDGLLDEVDAIVWQRVLGNSKAAADAASGLRELNNSTAAQRGWAPSCPGTPTSQADRRAHQRSRQDSGQLQTASEGSTRGDATSSSVMALRQEPRTRSAI